MSSVVRCGAVIVVLVVGLLAAPGGGRSAVGQSSAQGAGPERLWRDYPLDPAAGQASRPTPDPGRPAPILATERSAAPSDGAPAGGGVPLTLLAVFGALALVAVLLSTARVLLAPPVVLGRPRRAATIRRAGTAAVAAVGALAPQRRPRRLAAAARGADDAAGHARRARAGALVAVAAAPGRALGRAAAARARHRSQAAAPVGGRLSATNWRAVGFVSAAGFGAIVGVLLARSVT